VKPLTSHTCKLNPEEAARLQALLRDRGYEFRQVPYARFGASRDKLTVVFYESGKLVVQGKNTREFIEFVLEPEVLQRAELGYEDVLKPETFRPRIGVDESGKGDFFGPLCVAAVYVNERVIRAWEDTDIRDSKRITSDKKVREFADLIRKTTGCVSTVVPIGNEAYNRLYAKMGSVNRILAWGHARVIENLMEQRSRLDPPPDLAISDQFAASKDTVAKAMMAFGREIELVQRHKAESDLAVAAASILARTVWRRWKSSGKSVCLGVPRRKWIALRRGCLRREAWRRSVRCPRCTSERPFAPRGCPSPRSGSGGSPEQDSPTHWQATRAPHPLLPS